jgi:hypothetical protein
MKNRISTISIWTAVFLIVFTLYKPEFTGFCCFIALGFLSLSYGLEQWIKDDIIQEAGKTIARLENQIQAQEIRIQRLLDDHGKLPRTSFPPQDSIH